MSAMDPDRERDALREELSARIYQKVREDVLGRPRLPERTLTIVFTDIAGSSDLLSRLGDHATRPVLRHYAEVLRETLSQYGGTEVERAGDGFMLVFRSAREAVAFALALEDRLPDQTAEEIGAASEPGLSMPRVRVGMDTGEVVAEDRGYFGSTVFRAARICDFAEGGQILVSEATKVLAGDAAPRGVVDLGEHQLKGIGGPHRLFEVNRGPAER